MATINEMLEERAATALASYGEDSTTDKRAFLNRIRSMFNIDGYLLSEFTPDQQLAFVRDPVRYFISTDKAQSDAIWREIERRQR